MHDLATTLLRHVTRTGSHYDWLLEDPAAPARLPLVAMRLPHPPSHWLDQGIMLGRALPPHRRRYLRYQGPLSDQRGSVVRVDRGRCLALKWTADHLLLAVRMHHVTGMVRAVRLTPSRWRLHVQRAAAAAPLELPPIVQAWLRG